jgi:hypothetical protein
MRSIENPKEKEERIYSAMLAPMLQPAYLRKEELKPFLQHLDKKGLNSRRIYEREVKVRPPHWKKAPSYDDLLN